MHQAYDWTSIIATNDMPHGVWLYYRFAVSLRDISELLLARGIVARWKRVGIPRRYL